MLQIVARFAFVAWSLCVLLIVLGAGAGALRGGEVLAFSQREQIRLLDVQSGVVLTLRPNIPEGSLQPTWSPDGERLVFSAFISSGNIDLFTLAANGRDLQRLTDASGYDQSPSWSPDGGQIVFASNREDGRTMRLYVMNADGSEISRLLNFVDVVDLPDWSPASEHVVFERYTPGPLVPIIHRVNADGSDLRELTLRADYARMPDISPDGEQVLYVGNNASLWLMDIDGSNKRELLRHDCGFGLRSPRWSLDGERIAYSAACNGEWDLIIYDVAQGTRQRIYSSDATLQYVSWRP